MTTEIIVESGKAILAERRGRKPKYPFRTMKLSDSFPVPKDKHNSVRSAAIAFCKRHPELGMKFSVRTSWDGWTECFRVL